MAPMASLCQTSLLVRTNGSQALKGPYLVEMLPQPDLPFAEEHFVASGRQVLPMVGTADLEPGDLLGVARAPLTCAPIDVFQRTNRAPVLSPSTDVPEVAAVSDSCLTAAATMASTSPALLDHFASEQRASSCAFGTVCRRLCAT